MAQIIDLGLYYHIVVLLILIAVIWLLAIDMGYIGKKEGMDFAPAHEMRFLSLSTSPNSGASTNPYKYDKVIYN